MQHRPTCRAALLVTAATGTVLVASTFGVLPAVADATVPSGSSSSAATSTAPTPIDAVPASADPATSTPPPASASAQAATGAPAASTDGPASTTPSGSTDSATPAPDTDTRPTTDAAPAQPATADPTQGDTASTPASSTPASSTPAADPATSARPSTGTPGAGDADRPGHPRHDAAPAYPATTQAAPRDLGTAHTAQRFSADLRAEHADGADYSLRVVEGSLPDGLRFRDGRISGTPTAPGSVTAVVTATTEHGSASLWVHLTVESGRATGLGALVSSVPAAADGSYTWVAPDGSESPGPIVVPQGGSISVVPWAWDRAANPWNATADAVVTSDHDGDVVSPGADAVIVTFPHASQHVITVEVDCIVTSFVVEVTPNSPNTTPTEPTTPTTPTTPTEPTTPATPPVSTPSTSTPVDTTSAPLNPIVPGPAPQPVAAAASVTTAAASTDQLAYTGADTRRPLAWAGGLLAAGTALLGLRFVVRRRRG